MNYLSKKSNRDSHQKYCIGFINQNIKFPNSTHMKLEQADFEYFMKK